MAEIEAVEKENVVMRTGSCSVTILPHLGGKIASILIGDQELLQSPLAPYTPRTQTLSFDASDASGWDECLPSVAACEVETEAGLASIPDHGDLWRTQWLEITDQRSGTREQGLGTLRGQCFSLPLALERTVGLTESASGWSLRLDYTLRNQGSCAVPWSWAAHPLFAVEAGDRIGLPGSIETLRLEGSGGGRLGESGDTVRWPVAELAAGGKTDLSMAQGAESGIGDKLFAGPLNDAENWCVLERPGAGVRIKVGFDVETMPYLGLWICYGGWPDRPGKKQMCVAMEPTTAPVDSLAKMGPWSRVIEAGDSYSWTMTVEIESIPKVN